MSQKFQRSIVFVGDLRRFVVPAKSLGIKNIDALAKRPKLEDVLAEIKTLRHADPMKPNKPLTTASS